MDEQASSRLMRGQTASSNIAPAQSHVAFRTDEVKPFKVITLAQWLLSAVGPFDGEELTGNNAVTILGAE